MFEGSDSGSIYVLHRKIDKLKEEKENLQIALDQKINTCYLLQNQHLSEIKSRDILIKKMVSALNTIYGHTEDCSDCDESFKEDESCECGYTLVEQALSDYKIFVSYNG